jgi:hypothetical protein
MTRNKNCKGYMEGSYVFGIIFIGVILAALIGFITYMVIHNSKSEDPELEPAAQAASKPPGTLKCEPRMKLVNGVCVPEERYLSGFSYADCDQKYLWSKELDAYINDKKDLALVIKDKQLTCHPVVNGKIQDKAHGTRVLDVDVTFNEHPQNDVPNGTERTLSGFGSDNCDGHYRWSTDKKAFINDEQNRSLSLDGSKLMCRELLKDGNMGGSYGSRVIGAEGIKWG